MGANKMIRALGLFFVVSGLMGCAATDTLEVAPEDCAGIPNGSSVLDECGVCDGDGSTCGDCVGGTTRLVANDCSEPEPEPDLEIGCGSSTALGRQGSCVAEADRILRIKRGQPVVNT